MPRYNNLADKLREYGCRVVEVEGWRSRGKENFNPKGVVAHHTAGPKKGDAPSLKVCVQGRPDVSGPLAHVVLSRSGICYVIASGVANHAGKGGFRGLSGNSSTFGIEAENTGVGEPWPDVQLEAYYRCTAAMLDLAGRGADWVCGHKEWTTRKIDPNGINMNHFREEVAVRLGKTVPVQPPVQPGTLVLRKGSKGAAVKSLQNQLNFWGHNVGVADGNFGPATERGVKSLQKVLKLSQDGIYGPATRQAYEIFLWNMVSLAQAKNRPMIGPGAKGSDVKHLQQRLNAHGAKLSIDGDFGKLTEAAVVSFKKKKGLPTDPVVGPITWRALG